jgi:hypothetical protein
MNTSLAATMVRWCVGGAGRGEPMAAPYDNKLSPDPRRFSANLLIKKKTADANPTHLVPLENT